MKCITIDLQENTQREIMEKKRAEREKQKLEKEANKKLQQQDTASATGTKLNKPEEEEDIIGALMKEIRRGKTLRRRSEAQSSGSIRSGSSVRPGRSGGDLKQDDILRLQKIYEQAVTEPIIEEPEDTASATKPKVDVKVDGHVAVNGEQATAAKTVTADHESNLLSAYYRKDRIKSEAFAGMQRGRKDPIRHSFHYMPHYETTV